MEQYIPEQKKDIEERLAKAEVALKELQLFPSAIVQKVNIGDDVFADKVICYLADAKYAPKKSPYDKPNKKIV